MADADEELGDGLPVEQKMSSLTRSLEQLVEQNTVLNPEPFQDLISQLKEQAHDIGAVERRLTAVRRIIVQPMVEEMSAGAKLSKWSLIVGLAGGLLAIVSLAATFVW